MRARIWQLLTSTVGLVAARHGEGVNVMAAEWTYLVNKHPLYVAVTLHRSSLTGDLVAAAGEFSVTFCSESQASVARFVGSFSGRDVDKSVARELDWRDPVSTKTPWIAGGVLAGECLVRQVVDLPEYRMFVGEAISVHLPEESTARPLVKHDRMFALGQPLRQRLVAVCHVLSRDPLTLRLAGTGPWLEGDPAWRVTLACASGCSFELGAFPSDDYGDLLVDVALPGEVAVDQLDGARIVVARGDAACHHTECHVTGPRG